MEPLPQLDLEPQQEVVNVVNSVVNQQNEKMARGICVEVTVSKNNVVLKTIQEPIVICGDNWKSYIESLKISQKNVNLYLSQLVEEEKATLDIEQLKLKEAEECGNTGSESEMEVTETACQKKRKSVCEESGDSKRSKI